MLKKSFTFIKEQDRWFIDLPEYIEAGGQADDLEMVLGADAMLDLYAGKQSKVTLTISDTAFEGAEQLQHAAPGHNTVGSGADYIMPMFNGEPINQPVWLCDVTIFVFGKMPKVLYISKAAN